MNCRATNVIQNLCYKTQITFECFFLNAKWETENHCNATLTYKGCGSTQKSAQLPAGTEPIAQTTSQIGKPLRGKKKQI